MEPMWPFQDPPNVAVVTLKPIVSRERPILFVSHDADDGGWQFLGWDEADEAEASVVSLATMLRIDPSIAALANLPPGWVAWRTSPSDPWQRRRA